MCLQSDHTLSKCLGHLPADSKQEACIEERPLNTPTKFEFTITNNTNEISSIISDEPQNTEYFHLKHFLDSNDELAKTEQLIEGNRSRSNSPDNPAGL